ncbi:hypothetical protein BASA60_004807 [Batrachochytrium salamandrivorans]|nr:hypothetical protein BASA60_004807 [Batrachochytrium salamandrivorans]
MGIIKLDSFNPEEIETKGLAVLKAVMIIRSLLANELKDTNSVMYELRGNSGDPNVDPYAKAWQETEEGSRFTNVFFPNSVESVNTLGQAYLRPMGVFNDARCYSSCEVFSGSIQGHGAGTIFGEDERTGGGGATVMKLDPCLIRASPDRLQKFPFSQELTSGSKTYANALSVGVTQFVRTGRYKGQALRMWVSRQILLFVPSGLICSPTPLPTLSMIVLLPVLLVLVRRMVRESRTNKQKFSIPVSAAGSALGNNRITIVGKTAGKQVLKTIRNVRTIPSDDKYMKISTTGFTFTGTSDSINIGLNVDFDSDARFVISSTCLSRAATVLKTFSSAPRAVMTPKTFNGISGGTCLSKGTFPFTTKSEKFSVSLKFTSDQLFEFTGATINSFTVSAA